MRGSRSLLFVLSPYKVWCPGFIEPLNSAGVYRLRTGLCRFRVMVLMAEGIDVCCRDFGNLYAVPPAA